MSGIDWVEECVFVRLLYQRTRSSKSSSADNERSLEHEAFRQRGDWGRRKNLKVLTECKQYNNAEFID